MRSTDFRSVVSPLGSPAKASMRTAPLRAPSGGLSALAPKQQAAPQIKPTAAPAPALPHFRGPRELAMAGMTSHGQANLKLASGAPKKSGGIALPKLGTPTVGTGKTAGFKSGGHVLDADGDDDHNNTLLALIRAARGNGTLPKKYADGGSADEGGIYWNGGNVNGVDIPSYHEYLMSGAGGNDPSTDDYVKYVHEVYGAREPVTGSNTGAIPGHDIVDNSPPDPRFRSIDTMDQATSGAKVLAGAAYNLPQWMVPEVGWGLFGGEMARKAFPNLPVPTEEEYEDFPSKLGIDTSPGSAFRNGESLTNLAGSALSLRDLYGIAKGAPDFIRSLPQRASDLGARLNALKTQMMARSEHAKVHEKGVNRSEP